MRTDELRSVLHQHADMFEDHGAPARVCSVHDRVVIVRRRRHKRVAGVAALAIVAVALVVLPSQMSEKDSVPVQSPKPVKLAGYAVPNTQVLGGLTYDYRQGVQSKAGAKSLRMTLPRSDRRRALAWASNSKDLSAFVSLKVDGDEVSRSTAGGFESGQLLSEGSRHVIVVKIDKLAPGGLLGLAVYDRSNAPPDGVTKAGTTFRQKVGADSLLTARIGKPGQNEISFETTVPETGRLRFSGFCYGGSSKTDGRLMLDGDTFALSRCSNPVDEDPGAAGATPATVFKAGHVVRVRMWLTRVHGDENDRIADPDAVLGAAVYAVGPAAATVAGWAVPGVDEYEGRNWVYDRSIESKAGDRLLTLRLEPSDVPRLVTLATSGFDGNAGYARISVDGNQSANNSRTSRGIDMEGFEQVLQPGEPHTVTVKGSGRIGPRATMGLVVADLAD